MNRMKFTAQELYVLAMAVGKEKMYGIPDGFALIPDEERPAVRQQVSDALQDEGVLVMDFDGKVSVCPEYTELISVYCDCRKCLTVNRQRADGTAEDKIFWQYNGKLYCAEALEDDYVFRAVSEAEVKADLLQEKWLSVGASQHVESVIPQIALTKAKRHAMKNMDEDALRLLKQNGADGRTASVIYDGLQEKAQYLGLLLMEPSSDGCKKTEKAWLSSRGVLFAMGKTVVNYRTSVAFTEADAESVSVGIEELAAEFFGRAR